MSQATSPLVIITGGSRGIGWHLSQRFNQSCDVLSLSRTPPPRSFLHANSHQLHHLAVDLGRVHETAAALQQWLAERPHYSITTFISNAAVTYLGWITEPQGDIDLETAFRVNVFSPLALTRTLLASGRLNSTQAHLVYVVSSLGRPTPDLSFAGLGAYSMAKAALTKAALVQSRELSLTAPHVRVSRVHPGIVDTQLQDELRATSWLDPRFTEKTSRLPPYAPGDWETHEPADRMRTITPQFAAKFIYWVAQQSFEECLEHDFYHSQAFHRAVRQHEREEENGSSRFC